MSEMNRAHSVVIGEVGCSFNYFKLLLYVKSLDCHCHLSY